MFCCALWATDFAGAVALVAAVAACAFALLAAFVAAVFAEAAVLVAEAAVLLADVVAFVTAFVLFALAVAREAEALSIVLVAGAKLLVAAWALKETKAANAKIRACFFMKNLRKVREEEGKTSLFYRHRLNCLPRSKHSMVVLMLKPTSVSELKSWIDAGQAVVVDVREPGEYQEGHIAGSTLIPLAQVTLAGLPPHQGKKLVLQCRSGGRSRTACNKMLAEQQDLEVYNLEGGILAWQGAGYDIAC